MKVELYYACKAFLVFMAILVVIATFMSPNYSGPSKQEWIAGLPVMVCVAIVMAAFLTFLRFI